MFKKMFPKNDLLSEEKGNDGIGKGAEDNTSGISEFVYNYNGTIGGDNFQYKINILDEYPIFSFESMLYPDRKYMKKVVGNEILEKLNEIYLSCRIAEWDGYSKYNPIIHDGSGFSLNINFCDGKSLRADGTNAFPERYRDFISQIEKLFGPIRDELVGESSEWTPEQDSSNENTY